MKTPATEKISIARYGSMFGFEHNSCKAKVILNYNDNDEPVYGIAIKHLKDDNITFTYRHDVGLARSNTHLKEPQCPIEDIPCSQKLMEFVNSVELKSLSQEKRVEKQHGTKKPYNDYVEELCEFFNKYGYLFPAQEYGKYNEIDVKKIGRLLDRIYILANLMTACREYRKNYNKIFYYTFYLILSMPDNLNPDPAGEFIQKHECHPMALHIFTTGASGELSADLYYVDDLHRLFPDSREEIIGPYTYSDEDFAYYASLRAQPVSEEDEARIRAENQEFIKQLEATTPEAITAFIAVTRDTENNWLAEQHKVYPEDNYYYAVPDYFDRDGKNYYLQQSMYLGKREYDEVDDSLEVKYAKMIKFSYVDQSHEGRNVKLPHDFLFHFIYDITDILDINLESLNAITLAEDIDFNRDPRFTQQYKDALCQIAADAIKAELEYALREVHPVFDEKTLFPGWALPDLYTTIHYSLFFGNNGQMAYRVCENPYCNNLYSVVITNTRKKFCSETCRAAVAQRNKRMRDRLDEEERLEKAEEEKNQTV